MTFDLDLWPTDLKINRDHLLTKDYLPPKFEASGAKRYWVISCTRWRATDIPTYRSTDIPTDRPIGAKQYALLFQRGHNKQDTENVLHLSTLCQRTVSDVFKNVLNYYFHQNCRNFPGSIPVCQIVSHRHFYEGFIILLKMMNLFRK